MDLRKLVLISVFSVLLVGLFYRLLFEFYGLRVTSWWRAPWKNESVGGKTYSLHLLGLAWDVNPVGEGVKQVKRWLPWGRFVQEADHLHVQFL